MKFCSFLCVFCVFAALCFAADDEDLKFKKPLLGYVHDVEAKQIRPIAGAPGAALAGLGLSISDVAAVAISSTRGLAIASVPGDEQLRVIRLSDGETQTTLESATGPFEKAAFSPSARAVILYNSGCRCVQIVTGLEGTPHVERTTSIADDGLAVQSIALSDDAAWFAIGKRTDDVTQLSLFRAGEDEPVRVFAMDAAALAFSGNGNDLAVADEARRGLAILSNVATSAEITDLVAWNEGFRYPAAVAFHGGYVLVADAAAGIHLVNKETREVETIPCACKPSNLERTLQDGVFGITQINSGSAWVLQLNEATRKTMFVPVERVEVAQ